MVTISIILKIIYISLLRQRNLSTIYVHFLGVKTHIVEAPLNSLILHVPLSCGATVAIMETMCNVTSFRFYNLSLMISKMQFLPGLSCVYEESKMFTWLKKDLINTRHVTSFHIAISLFQYILVKSRRGTGTWVSYLLNEAD